MLIHTLFKTFKPFKSFKPSDKPEIVLNDLNGLNDLNCGVAALLLPIAYLYTSPPTLPTRRAIKIMPMQTTLTISASEHMGPRLPST